MTQSQSQNVENSFDKLLADFQSRLHTILPGVVESYDPKTKTAEIRPPFSKYYELDGGGDANLDWPILPDVPVIFPRAAGGQDIWPIKKGVVGLLLFCQYTIEDWQVSDGKTLVTPDDSEPMHSESNAVFIPGLYPEGDNPGPTDNKYRWMIHDDTIKIKGPRVEIGETDNPEALAKASKTDGNDNALWAGINPLRLMLGFPPVELMQSAACAKAFGG